MNSYEECRAVADLDLDPIKVKLMHRESGEGWTRDYANAVETEYRRFLYLMKMFPNEDLSPSGAVDIFWHYHILDTMKYARDCDAIFGYFLHHFPYVGLRGEDDLATLEQMGERMRELYQATFGQKSPVQLLFGTGKTDEVASAYCAAPGQPAAAGTLTGGISSGIWIASCAVSGHPASTAKHHAGLLSAQKAAYCAAPGRPANTNAGSAYCAAPGRPADAKQKDYAYCAAPGRPANATMQPAYCAAPGRAVGAWPSKVDTSWLLEHGSV
jgi:hypothetical protein